MKSATSADVVFGEARETRFVASLTRPDAFSATRNPGWFGPSFTTIPAELQPEPVPEPATLLSLVPVLGMGGLLQKRLAK